MENSNGVNKENKINIPSSAEYLENAVDFGIRISKIVERDKRYNLEAYNFVMTALQHTLRKLDEHRHISGRELLDGIRQYTLQLYGPMSLSVLEHWGIKNTDDFGEIVFNLVEAGLMHKRPEDSKEEFRGIYDFKTAFSEPYKRSIAPKVKLIRKKKAK